ncbi:Hypothetical predicted protein, partial [Pelobates cultripes]
MSPLNVAGRRIRDFRHPPATKRCRAGLSVREGRVWGRTSGWEWLLCKSGWTIGSGAPNIPCDEAMQSSGTDAGDPGPGLRLWWGTIL